ncbi:hypothetical protein [uncultured Roseobacter sp.]|uniref:hypothetical protein n=1 Tax=uncultured Roseobacter sp. TaxID=114847 RepID=UPI0026399529|nr:hypothetical protein [uncultured Roseobacter sp.]
MQLSEETLYRVENSIKNSDDLLKYTEAMKLQAPPPKLRFWENDGFYKFLAGGAGALAAAALLTWGGIFDVLGKTHAAQTRLLDTAQKEYLTLTEANEQLIFTSRALYACNFSWGETKGRKELRTLFNELTDRYNDKLPDGELLPLGPEENDYSLQAVLFSDGKLWYRVFTSERGNSAGRDDRAEDGTWHLTDKILEIKFEFGGQELFELQLDRADAFDFAQGKPIELVASSQSDFDNSTFYDHRSCGQYPSD